ncbi:hypothetical protein J4408_00790 [Candidatus Pacearchaeota archaeon]|nr:hypothetical protein [Candidatus Pacearchaeota archaeon]
MDVFGDSFPSDMTLDARIYLLRELGGKYFAEHNFFGPTIDLRTAKRMRDDKLRIRRETQMSLPGYNPYYGLTEDGRKRFDELCAQRRQ